MLFDSNGAVVSQNSGSISGAAGQETAGYAEIDTLLIPQTYRLAIKVLDRVTGWSTEHEAYLDIPPPM